MRLVQQLQVQVEVACLVHNQTSDSRLNSIGVFFFLQTCPPPTTYLNSCRLQVLREECAEVHVAEVQLQRFVDDGESVAGDSAHVAQCAQVGTQKWRRILEVLLTVDEVAQPVVELGVYRKLNVRQVWKCLICF